MTAKASCATGSFGVGARHETVDLDHMGALDLDCFQLVILDHEVLALGHLVATAFVFGGDRLMGFLIDELLAEADCR